MSLRNRVSRWLRRAFQPEVEFHPDFSRLRQNWLRPRVEVLEDRIVPTVFGSTNVADNLTVNTFGANDVLSLEITGASTYDRVTSSANQVAGTLFVQFRGYNAAVGEKFTLIDFASAPTDYVFDRSIAIVSDTADQFKTYLNAAGDLVLEVVDAATQAAQATFQTLAGTFSYNTASVPGGTAYAISASNVKLSLPDPVDNLFGNLGSATFNGSLILVEAGANSGLAGSLTGNLNLGIGDVTLSGTLGIRINTSAVAINLPDVDPGAGVLAVNVPAGPFFGFTVNNATLNIGSGLATLTGDFAFETQGANLRAFADVNVHINLGTIAGVNTNLDIANYLAIIDYNASLDRFNFNISGPVNAPYLKAVGQATGNLTVDLSGSTPHFWGAAALTTQAAFTKLGLIGVTPTGPNKAWLYLNSDTVAHDVTITYPDLTTQAVHVNSLSFGMGIEANLTWKLDGETWFTLDQGLFDLRISADTGATLFVNADLVVGDLDAPLLTLDAQGAIILGDDGDSDPTESGEGAAGMVKLTAVGNPFGDALGVDMAGTFLMIFNATGGDMSYTPPSGVSVPGVSFPIVIPGGPPPAGTAPTANTWNETSTGPYLLIHADAQMTVLDSLTVDGDFHMVVSTDAINIHAAGDLDFKIGGTTVLGYDVDGTMSLTSAGLTADVSLTQTVNAPSGFSLGAGMTSRLQIDTTASDPYARVRATGNILVGGFKIDGTFDITVALSYLNIHAIGTMDVMAGSTKVFGVNINGDFHAGVSGVAASFNVTLSATVPTSLGFSMSASFKLEVNTFSTNQADEVDLGLDAGPYVHLHGDGSLTITAVSLTLFSGDFDIFYVGTNLKLDIGATVSVLGTNLTLDGQASISTSGLSFDISLTGEALYPSSSFEITGTLTLHVNTDPANFEAYVAVTNAEVNIYGFVMTGGFRIGISSSGFSITIPSATPLSLDFFDIVTFSVSGTLNSSGTFSFTASTGFDYTDDDLDVGVDGSMSVTISNSGFAGSFSGSAVIFGETIAGISATVSVSNGSVSLSFTATITLSPEITVDLPSVTVYYPDPSWDDPFNWSSYTYDPPPETVPAVRASRSFTLNLGSVSAPDVPPPAPLVLAHLDGTTLYLHMGADAGLRNQQTTDNGESFIVSHFSGNAGSETVHVKAFGVEQEFTGVSKIVVTDAGTGDDVVNVQSGVLASVEMNGGSGNDTLTYAGSGTAKLNGGEGNDQLSGGSGNDELNGGAGDDKLQGNGGADKLHGDADNDQLDGGTGNDELYGDAGNDRLQGGDNDDRLEGGTGNDANYGDAGNDQIVWNVGDGNDTRVDGGLGSDTITVNGTSSAETVTVGAAADNNSFVVTFAGATLSAGVSIENLILDGQGGADNFTINDSGAALSTHLSAITLKLGGDTAADSVTINGSSGTDVFNVAASGGVVTVGRPSDGKGGPAGLTTSIEQGGIGSDTLTLDMAGGDDIAVVKSTLNGLATTIKGGGGDGKYYLGSNAPPTAGDLNGIAGALTIQGGANTDYLFLDDSADTAGNSGTLTSTQITGLGLGASGITYSGIEQLEIKLGSGADSFTIASTNAGTNTLKTNGGADTVEVRAIAGATTVETGSENDTINVGSNAGVSGSPAGNVNGIAALLTVNGGAQSGGNDVLNVDDTADSAANSATLSSTQLTGLGMTSGIAYSALEALNINLGSGGDTVTITGTHAGATTLKTNGGADTVHIRAISGGTTVETGSENDTINVGSKAGVSGSPAGNVNGFAGLLTLDGGSHSGGSDTLNVDDTADTSSNVGTLSSTQLTGLGMTSGITYSALEALNISLGSGGDTFTIDSTHAGSTQVQTNAGADTVHVRAISGATTVQTGSENDTINVGSNAGVSGGPAGNVNGIAALLTVDGGAQSGGSDVLNVDDTADSAANTGSLTSTQLTGLGMTSGITYSALEALNVNLGSGGDIFTVVSTHAGSTTLKTNGGADTVHIRTIAGATTVETGNENDTINVGSNAGVGGSPVGNVNSIAALLTLDGGTHSGGSDTLNVDDTADSSANSGTLTSTQLTGLGMASGITYVALEALNINLGSGGDTFNIQSTGGSTTTTLKTGGGNDTINVGSNAPASSGNVNAVAGGVTVQGEGGTDTLNVDDTGDGVANSGDLTGTQLTGLGLGVGITYATLESLNINLGSGGDTFTVASTHVGSTTLKTNGGADTVDVRTIAGATTVETGSENDVINVGSNAGVSGNPAGNVNGIAALLTVDGGIQSAGSDVLSVDDTADSAGNTGNLTSTQLTGLGMTSGIIYSALEALIVNLGTGGDTFTIVSTHVGTTSLTSNGGADTINVRTIAGATTVETGSENDVINVGSNAGVGGNPAGNVNGIAALLTLDGGTHSGGSDTLNVDDTVDSSANSGTLTSTQLTGLGMASGITYSALEALNINLGGGGDTFNIQSTGGSTTTTLKTGGGNDTINVGSNAPATTGNVNAVAGGVTVQGEGGTDTLNVDDTGDSVANSGDLTSTQLTGLGLGVGITYATLESLNINLGSGGDTFTIASTHAGTTALNTNDGADTVHVRTIGGATSIFTGAADDVINVGSNAGVGGSPAGNVNAIVALLTVDGGGQGAKDQLNVDDTADTLANVGNLTGTDLTGLGMAAGINYAALEELNIRLGSGGDTFTIQSTHAGTTNLFTNGGADTVHVRTIAGPTNVATGAGDDTVNVGSTAPGALGTLDGIAALLAIDGGLNLDTVNVDDTGTAAALAGTLTNNLLTGLDMQGTGSIGYTALEAFNLALGTGGTTMLVPSTNLGTLTKITGNSGNDVFNVGSTRAANSGNLNLVQGQLTLIGGGGNDQLNANDHGATGAYNYTLSPTALVNDPAPVPVQTLPTPTTPPARTFAGIVYNASSTAGLNTIQTVRLDGTDQVNIFTVRPSLIAEYLVNGNLPASGVPLPGGGDYLKLDTTGTTGRKLQIDTVDGVPAPGSGHWGFTSAHKDVSFTSIERFNHVDILAVAADASSTSTPIVKVYDAETMEFKFQVTAYEANFRGGVHVATGDENFDGIPDLITAPGTGRDATIKIFNGTPDADGNYAANYRADFNQIAAFNAYPTTFRGGAFVAVGDVNYDGANDIITGPGKGTQPLVNVYDGKTLTAATPSLIGGKAILAFATTFRGGVSVAAGDINKDGKAEVIVGSGPGMQATVRVFDGNKVALGTATTSVRAIVPFGTFTGGTFVAVGDYNGDGYRDVIVGTDSGTKSLVNVYTGKTLYAAAPARLASITAYATTYRGGARVVAKPLDGGDPGTVEKIGIVMSPGAGSVSRNVRRATFSTPTTISLIDLVFMDSAFMGGIALG